ncbi:undecaprenyl-phosphate glucose phosphotransferase [Paenibacillus sp. y28]|uniref:undecaprenyl-phosphate glucose phosphotransferase n=1 Tax=Paenibacillus sp. y28 TaxID=3129110 RepID=UPI00301A9D9C
MIRKNERFLTQVYSVTDFLIIQLAFIMAWWIKFNSGIFEYEQPISIKIYFLWSLIYGLIVIGAGYISGFYSSKRKKRFSFEVLKILQIHSVGILLLISVLFIMKEIHISRYFLGVYLITNISLAQIYRYMVKIALKRFRQKGFNKQFVLILGAGSLGRRFYENLKHHPELGFEIVGFLDDYQQTHEAAFSHYKPIIGGIDDLETTLQTVIVDEVIIALPLDAHHKYAKIINQCEKAGVRTMIIPDFFDLLPARPYFDNFAGIPLINVRDIPLDELRNRLLKRVFDIVFSLAAIIVTLPVMILIAIGIKLTSRGPILFKQERVGFNRRTFMMYKFRSMKVVSQNSSDTGWTTENDPRKTKFGSFLRKTSLDELPQFFNVLIGNMSVVGPRPERPYYVDQFKEEIPKYMVKHHIRPGITGWAQTNGLRGDTSIEDRISYDIFYIENWTFLFDIKIIIKTLVNGLVNRNAY